MGQVNLIVVVLKYDPMLYFTVPPVGGNIGVVVRDMEPGQPTKNAGRFGVEGGPDVISETLVINN